MQRLLLLAGVVAAAAASFSLAAPPPPPPLPPLPPFSFDALFGDNMVLQREPNKAAVYGYVGGGGSGVSVTIEGCVRGRGRCDGGGCGDCV